MAAKSPTGTAEENSSPPEEADNETLREIFEKLIAGNPRFQEAEKCGRAFVVGAKLPRTS